MFLRKISLSLISLTTLALASSDMEVKTLDAVSEAVKSEVLVEKPQLKIGSETLREFFPYPKALIENGVEGEVIVEFDVTKRGYVSNWQIIGSPNADLENIVLSGIRFLEFEPGKQNGKPVTVRHRMPVIFENN